MRKIAVRKLTTSVDGRAYASDLAASVLLGCWAAGHCGAQRPVMCGAGLHVRAWGGGVGVGVRQSGAVGLCRPGAAAAWYGLAAVAARAAALIWILVRMDFLAIRGPTPHEAARAAVGSTVRDF